MTEVVDMTTLPEHHRVATLQITFKSGAQIRVDVFTFELKDTHGSGYKLNWASPTGHTLNSLIHLDPQEVVSIVQVGDWRPVTPHSDGVSYVPMRPQ